MKYWNATWNPITGCTPASEGCANCWAKEMHERFHGKGSFGKVTLHEDRLTQPLHWRKPRVVFTDMCDPFHEDVPDEFLDQMLAVIALCPQHQFLLLTKRAKRMREYFTKDRGPYKFEADHTSTEDQVLMTVDTGIAFTSERMMAVRLGHLTNPDCTWRWPLPNLWLGVTTENQQTADERIPDLLATPAAHRWVSVEPMLGAVDLWDEWRFGEELDHAYACDTTEGGYPRSCMHTDCDSCEPRPTSYGPRLDWIIVGGESGSKARPCNVDWIRSIVWQCGEAGVKCLVKQLGSRPFIDTCPECGHPEASHEMGRTVGCQHGDGSEENPICGCRKMRGELSHVMGDPRQYHPIRDRSGTDPSEWPALLRVQQYPEGLQP